MHSKTRITVRYAETDMMGIVHHSNHAVWYEIGRADYIKLFGISYTEMESMGVMTPVLNLNCSFKHPALYDDSLILRTWVADITASRIVFTYKINRLEDDGTETEIGYGSTEHAFVDSKTFKPCSIKKKIPFLYEKISATFK